MSEITHAQSMTLRRRWKYALPWTLVLIQMIFILHMQGGRYSQTCQHETCLGKCASHIETIGLQVETIIGPIGQKAPVNSSNTAQLHPVSNSNNKTKQQNDIASVQQSVQQSLLGSGETTRIIYNRVPKCGSSSMIELIEQLSKSNNFTFARAPEYMRFYLEEKWQRNFVSRVKRIPPPMIYERHLHFLDFTKFGLDQPVYINLVREPLERLVSWYYFRRYQIGHVRNMKTSKRVMTYDECVLRNVSECVDPLGGEAEEGYFKLIPFFCGQAEYCRIPGDKALITAMDNVKRHYAVIGVTEEFSKFLEALEFTFPKFFTGASNVYRTLEKDLKSKYQTKYKLPISTEVSNIMFPKLKQEYQFYHFLRQRFKRLMEKMNEEKSKSKGNR